MQLKDLLGDPADLESSQRLTLPHRQTASSNQARCHATKPLTSHKTDYWTRRHEMTSASVIQFPTTTTTTTTTTITTTTTKTVSGPVAMK